MPSSIEVADIFRRWGGAYRLSMRSIPKEETQIRPGLMEDGSYSLAVCLFERLGYRQNISQKGGPGIDST